MRLRRALALLCACGLAPASASMAAYPDKSVRVVVPAAAGTTLDHIAHLITPLLGVQFGQRFIVDNRSGAEGMLGTELVARATPDGCTLLIGTPATLTTTAFRRLQPAYDAKRDFAAIGLVASSPFVLAVHPGVPAESLQDLVALARTGRGRLAYGTSRNGNTAHIAMELLQQFARFDLKRSGYAARSDLLGHLVAGNVQIALLEVRDAMDHVRARRLRPLAVTVARRTSALPQVPTTAEAGLAGFEASKWTGLLAPARTPPDVVEDLAIALRRVLANPGVRWQMGQEGLQPGEGESAHFAKTIAREIEAYGKVTKLHALRWH